MIRVITTIVTWTLMVLRYCAMRLWYALLAVMFNDAARTIYKNAKEKVATT